MLARLYQGCSLSWSVLTRGKQTPVFMLVKSKSRLRSTAKAALPSSPFSHPGFLLAFSRARASRQI